MQISSSSEAESELEIESDLKVNLTKNSAPTESRPKRLKLKSFIRPKEQDSTEKARLSVGDVFEMEGQSSAKKSHLKKPQVLLAFFLGSFSPNSYVVSE